MKRGSLVKRRSSLDVTDPNVFYSMREELVQFNREIGFIWALCSYSNPPPIFVVSMPRAGSGLVIDDKCKDFSKWMKSVPGNRVRNSLTGKLVRVLWCGEIIVTFSKWVEEIEPELNSK